MDIYKEKANEIARMAHAEYCQRLPKFNPDLFSTRVAMAIRDALVEAADGRLSADDVPKTDAHVEQCIRESMSGGYGDAILGLYQVARQEGKSVARAWGEALCAGAGEDVSEFIKAL